MIVLDASLVVEILINGPLADAFRRETKFHGNAYAAPHLLDVEVVSALRGLAVSSQIDPRRVQEYIRHLSLLPVTRYAHTDLLRRVWELRHNFTAYDASYIALAEALDAPLYTTDHKMRKGHGARVVVIAPRTN